MFKPGSYRGQTDRRQMQELLCTFPAHNFHVVDAPYRLSTDALENLENISIWEDEDGKLVGFAIFQPPFAGIDYALDPQANGLEDQILDWAIRQFPEVTTNRGKGLNLYIDVGENDLLRQTTLERHGFTRQDWRNIYLARSLDELLPPLQIPEGFTIRPLNGAEEVAAYVRTHRAVFDSTSMTEAWRKRTLQMPEYNPEIDLVAIAPDGTLAAFCICWLSQGNLAAIPGAGDLVVPGIKMPAKIGQIEPLGVLPAYRRRGLGQAILREALHRLYLHGATCAIVMTDHARDAAQQLYLSGGFAVSYTMLKYAREF